MEQLEHVKDTVVNWCMEGKGMVSDYFEKPVLRTKKQTFTTGALLFFIGVVVGFLFAPIRKGITICSNNVDSFSSNEAYDNNQASSTNYKGNKKKGR